MKYIAKMILMMTAALTVSACGGGGGGSSSSTQSPTPQPTTPTTPAPTVLTGTFLDSAVSGLQFETATQSGSTDSEGNFSYVENEQITFSIGDIAFPSVTAASALTPLTFFATQDINNVGVVNTVRLLQSLDTDGIAENGIEISDAIHTLAAGMSVDFTANNFSEQVQPLFESNGGVYQSLISQEQALAHFQETLDVLAGSPPVTCGTDHPMVGYTGTFQTRAHNVAGTAKIVDNCTIEVENFDYDGGGPLVYFYVSDSDDFTSSSAYRLGPRLDGIVHDNANITIKLSEHNSLDDIQWMSVWCIDFNANFGELRFAAP